MLLAEILPKNKELLAVQERLKIECDAQSTTLEEQRTHIEMLEKALANAQERIAAKERQAVDAVAIVDKCSHLQKLLQESLDDKQKRQEEHNKQKAQLEMELASLRMQIAKDHSNFGPRKGAKSPENEEIVKLKKTIYTKDERISQLENNLLEIQKRYNEELQRNDSMILRCESDALNLENEKAEKERRIQELLDEKQRIHCQWADERHSLDHRVRLLEQDLRHLVNQSSVTHSIGSRASSPLQNYPYSNNLFYGTGGEYFTGPLNGNLNNSGRASAAELPTSVKAAVLHDSTMARMEELRKKMADRRASNGSWTGRSSGTCKTSVNSKLPNENSVTNIINSSTSGSKSDSKNSSNLSLHSRASSASDVVPKKSLNNNQQNLQNTTINYSSGNSITGTGSVILSSNGQYVNTIPNLTSPTSSKMSSHMPDSYCETYNELPASSRRRFAAVSERVSHAINGRTLQNRSSSQAPNPQIMARVPIRDRSAETRAMLFSRNVKDSLDANERHRNQQFLQNRVSRASKAEEQRISKYDAPTNDNKPPTGSLSSRTNNIPSTTIVEVNRDHLKAENLSALDSKKLMRRSSIGSFSSAGEN